MRINQKWTLPMLMVSVISISPGAHAVNLYLRAGSSTCLYDATTSQTLQKTSGTNQTSIAFSAQTNTFTFYSTPLTNAVLVASNKLAGGTFSVQNNGSADFQFNASEILYDYDPATGNQTQIVAVPASGVPTAVSKNKTARQTLTQVKVGTAHTVPTNHMLRVDITVTVNLTSGINGALVYNAPGSKGKSLVQLPTDNSINWPFGPFATTPNSTITVPSSVKQNSTGNVASVVNAGASAIYAWSITNGTITAGQSTPQITWTAGASGSVGLGVSIVNNCFSSSGAATVALTVRSNQTVTFNSIPTQTYGNSPITLVATASSSLPVTFSVVSGPATVSGSTLTITGAGTVIVDANQAGNSTYNPGVAQQSFAINPVTLTVTGITASNKVYDSTTTAAINTNSAVLVGVISGDSVTLDPTFAAGNFTNDTIGTSIEVDISGLDITGGSAGNYTLVQPITSANITAAGITVSGVTANDKVYDGTTTATLNTGSAALIGVVTGDDVTLDVSSAASVFADKNVGAGKTVTISGLALAGADAGNYTLTQPDTMASITAQPLTVSATGMNKVYDGTTAATVTLSDNRVSGDSLSTSYTSASFSDKNAGTGKTVSVNGISVTGADAGNYSYNTTASTTANITGISVSGSITAANKVYDGTTAATIASRNLTGVLGSDSVSLTGGTATFSDKNVGTGKTVTATGLSITGTDAGNYTLVSSGATTTANITVLSLTVSATGVNKVYDGTATATVSLSDNRVSGDSLSTSYTGASFSDKNVGTGKAVSVTGISVTGADVGNYSYNTTASTTANITAVSVSGSVTASDKVYDGTTAATIASRNLTGVLGTDSVSLTGGTATFSDKNVGTGKTVTATGLSITGTDAGNYTLASSSATTMANITASSLTVSAIGVSKVYDGTAAATVTLSDNRVSGDSLSVSYASASFSDKSVGTGKTVSVNGISVTGADAGNYSYNTTASTTANITVASVSGSVTASDKVYDGTTAATITSRNLTGIFGSDSVSLTGGTATFNDKNVGTGKTVTVTGLSITGTDAGNYTLASSSATTTANITVSSLTVSATGVNKVYDGTATATVSLSDNRVSGDNLSTSYTGASFSDKNVGTGKTVSVTGISVTGADAGNYSYNSTASTTANITAVSVSGSVTANSKYYDGTTAATIASRNLTGVFGSDSASLTGGTAAFSDDSVGTNKTVTATGLSITGTDAGNYTLASSTTTTTASIMAPPQAPSIAISMGPDGAHINCTGAPGQPFAIQSATNLVSGNWTIIHTDTIGTNGLSSYIDPVVGGRSACFYRAMVSY